MNITLHPVSPQQDLPMVKYTDTKKKRYNLKEYAPMGEKTLKIRNRLEKRLHKIDQQITDEKLALTKDKIHNYIERNSSDRVLIKKATMHLFTGGKSVAPLSRKIQNIQERLKAELYAPTSFSSDLKGRIKK